MCGRYTLSRPGDIVTELGAETSGLETSGAAAPGKELAPRYNIAPTQAAPVVRPGKEGGKELALLRWGLIPFWAEDTKIGNRMINARAETVAEKPSFKASLKRRRCVILADGFYEWRKMRGGAKQPYHIHLLEGRPFTMAGLWDRWTKGDEGPIDSFTIITTAANEAVAPLHDRMPVILDPEGREVWLDRAVEDPGALVPLLRPYRDDQIAFDPVSKIVNSPMNDVPECLRPIEL